MNSELIGALEGLEAGGAGVGWLGVPAVEMLSCADVSKGVSMRG